MKTICRLDSAHWFHFYKKLDICFSDILIKKMNSHTQLELVLKKILNNMDKFSENQAAMYLHIIQLSQRLLKADPTLICKLVASQILFPSE